MQRYFKLETYIGKFLLSYLNKYVKLRDDQFALSIWEGDLIFTQLELRYDFLENLIPFPISFWSGQIQELRIHVPWTKLYSECIEITLDKVECIFGLKKPNFNNAKCNLDFGLNGNEVFDKFYQSTSNGSDSTGAPGYFDIYIARILSNIKFVINILNIKLMVEDIVLSMSINNVDCVVTDFNWKPTIQNFNLRSHHVVHRLVNFRNMTLCLDRAGPSGYVKNYEQPIVYRFSLICYLQFLNMPMNREFVSSKTMLCNVQFCFDKLDLQISVSQIVLLSRLLEIISNIHFGTLDWSLLNLSSTNSNLNESIEDHYLEGIVLKDHIGNSDIVQSSQSQSWTLWAWSYASNILSSVDDLGNNFECKHLNNLNLSCSEFYQDLTDSERIGTLINLILEDSLYEELNGEGRHGLESVESKDASPNLNISNDTNGQLNEKLNLNLHHCELRRCRIRCLQRMISFVNIIVLGVYFENVSLNVTVSLFFLNLL